jgi:hypothetical protein
MRTIIVLLACAAVASALDIKPCEEWQTEIATKMEANGVKNYELDIVAAGDVKDRTVVGTCEGGTKKITYSRTAVASSAADICCSFPAAATKPSPTAPKQ